ncbi:MAG: Fe-Mn family superoxide dismutase [Myxococcota bacterium]
MAIELPALPWAQDALAPHISPETIEYHYGKHHAGYVKKLNTAIEGTDLASKSLVDIIRAGGGTFNNAAQIWNHTFYWNSMAPGGGGAPSGAIADAINGSFGSYDTFAKEFASAAATQFGSGWAWLVAEGDKLAIEKSKDAETPITSSAKPLLTIDVWEHAYYVDFRNARPDYIQVFLDSLVNWDFANQNLSG